MKKNKNEITIDGVIYIKKETAVYQRAVSKLIKEIEFTKCNSSKDVENLSNAVKVLLDRTDLFLQR